MRVFVRELIGLLLCMLTLTSASCIFGVPPGFSPEATWTLPLTGASEHKNPVTQVKINGQGPYLFYVSLTATSTISIDLARQLELWEITKTNHKGIDENDKVSHEQIKYFDIPSMSVGDLVLSNRRFIGLESGGYYKGQPVLGVIGRDIVIADSLVWKLDRDRQVLQLFTQKHFVPPAVKPIKVDKRGGEFYMNVKINDAITAYLAISPHRESQIWPQRAEEACLRRVADDMWVASQVVVDTVRAKAVPMRAFRDKRVRTSEYDGILGVEFWSRFNITINSHQKLIWLEPRSNELTRSSQTSPGQ